MDFQHVLKQRRSVRAYEKRVPTREQLEEVFAAVAQAPSAAGLQAYRIHVVAEEGVRRGLGMAAQGQAFVGEAPVVLVFCADTSRAVEHGTVRETQYSVQDALVAVAYAQLAVVEQYLSSCWVGAFDSAQVKALLGLPENEIPVGLMPVGYPAVDLPEPQRRSMDELVSWHGMLAGGQ
jgi:nitroreductase